MALWLTDWYAKVIAETRLLRKCDLLEKVVWFKQVIQVHPWFHYPCCFSWTLFICFAFGHCSMTSNFRAWNRHILMSSRSFMLSLISITMQTINTCSLEWRNLSYFWQRFLCILYRDICTPTDSVTMFGPSSYRMLCLRMRIARKTLAALK